MSIIIDGRKIANDLELELSTLKKTLQEEAGIKPGLAVIRVGEDPASKIYIQAKGHAANKLDFLFEEHTLPENAPQQSLENKIRHLNQDHRIHGIILQLPLPRHLDASRFLPLIDPSKDVDGINPMNSGKLFEGFPTLFIPCAPLACLSLIQSVEQRLEGLTVGIVGCSFLVGRPLAMLMLKQNCTVWMGHIKTRNLPDLCKTADILIAAIGSPNFIHGSWIKKGTIVIDVGINRLPSGALAGDVDFSSAQKVAKAITPVPGGVGPMTVTSLLRNTLKAACTSVGKQFLLD